MSSALIAKWLLLSGFVGALPAHAQTGIGVEKPLMDPTRPSGWRTVSQHDEDVPTVVATRQLRLQGIFQTAGRRTALINGQRVAVGELVGGGEVVSIGKRGVTLLIDGETVELASMIPAVKSPAQDTETEGERR